MKIILAGGFRMFKYFKIDSNSTVDTVKKQFKRLARELHPDFNNGCKVKEFQFKEMLAEYDQSMKYVGEQKNKNYTSDPEYTDLVLDLLRMEMENVDIEICGWFIYLWGNTKPYKEELKKKGFRWNPKKVCWYWRPAWYKNKSRRSWDMKEIREVYGSEKVQQKQEQKEQEREKELLTA
jgi:hypothetical protein